jgi:hypothetical protein
MGFLLVSKKGVLPFPRIDKTDSQAEQTKTRVGRRNHKLFAHRQAMLGKKRLSYPIIKVVKSEQHKDKPEAQ